tara:strand:- start:6347 stop:6694 length:348 start_codon:yes stop_codon:yes gene_type:complete
MGTQVSMRMKYLEQTAQALFSLSFRSLLKEQKQTPQLFSLDKPRKRGVTCPHTPIKKDRIQTGSACFDGVGISEISVFGWMVIQRRVPKNSKGTCQKARAFARNKLFQKDSAVTQ